MPNEIRPGIRRMLRLFTLRSMQEGADEEIRFHLDQRTKQLISQGMSPAEARAEAERLFGEMDAAQQLARASAGRQARRRRWRDAMDVLRGDIRYAARGLLNKPGFAAAVILTLGLGIGANAAMFGIVDRLLFRAPAFMVAPDRVHRVYLARTFDGKEGYNSYFQYTRYEDLKRWTTSFDVVAAVSENDAAVGTGENAREMRVGAVSASFFKLFNAPPVVGRYFTPAEDTTPVGAAVAVLSNAYWQTRYGGRADAIGQVLKISKTDYTIVGVAPEDFVGMARDRVPVAFIPITTYASNEFTWNPKDLNNWYQKYNISWMQMLARRKPGVTQVAAQADLTSAYLRSYARNKEMSPALTPAELSKPRAVAGGVLSERGPQPSETSKVATWVAGVAAIVLLIAAANVANLLLARALRRRREVAVRLALGVSRMRLLSQLMTESLLLAALGGVVGMAIAQFGGKLLRSQFSSSTAPVPVLGDVRTLLFAGVAVAVVGLLTGLAPALQSTRADLTDALKSGSREGTYHKSKTRVALLVLQGALSVVLLVGAGLFVRSLNNVKGLRMGFDVDKVIWVGVEERGEKMTEAEKSALRDRLADAARGLQGVENASRAVTVPFHIGWDEGITVPGHDTAKLNRFSWRIQAAAPQYLSTMGTRLLSGRFIESHDLEKSAKVMVVSESMASYLWPGKSALGQCVKVGSDTMPCTEVVGVAEDVRADDDFAKDSKMYYYRPLPQAAPGSGGMFVRTSGEARKHTEAIRRQLQTLMPGSSYVTVTPMSQIMAPNIRSWRLGATMFVAFGGLALVLAAIGLYSVIAYNVAQRTHELGVRVAFGAQVLDVVRLVLTEGLKVSVAGVVIGGGIAFYAARWVKPLLFNVDARDPAVFGVVIAALLLVATLASLVPAVRAARVDPNVALRSD